MPGQSPIPVVIIEQDHGMTTGEWWVTVSAFALTGVTLLSLLAIVHQDHEMVILLRKILSALTPPYRSPGLRPGKGSPGTDVTNVPAEQVNKIIAPRS